MLGDHYGLDMPVVVIIFCKALPVVCKNAPIWPGNVARIANLPPVDDQAPILLIGSEDLLNLAAVWDHNELIGIYEPHEGVGISVHAQAAVVDLELRMSQALAHQVVVFDNLSLLDTSRQSVRVPLLMFKIWKFPVVQAPC